VSLRTRRTQRRVGSFLVPSVPNERIYQHHRRVQQPRHVQCLRHRHHALLTGEAFSAAWLMLFPLAGAAIDVDGATASPIPAARRITKAIFFIVVPSTKG
jgi:hypothetical protein